MFVEHRAFKRLRKRDPTCMATRYAGAMYRARLYARYAQDKTLAMQMQALYERLKATKTGQRVISVGQKQRKKVQ
jgi:hypothetical protein